jgi:nucleotide-binding universal stress UspA family protein
MKILFCSDGSSQAENAVRFGASIAAACQAEVSILGIVEKAGQEDAVLQALRRAQEILKEYHLNAELITKAGRPVREIIKRTQETQYDLVVVGAVRKGTRRALWMSARAYKLIESVEPPVLVVIGSSMQLRRILVCDGGTHKADAAVQFAGEIARHLNASVDLLHVLAEPPAVYANLVRSEDDVGQILQSSSALGRCLRSQKELLEKMAVPCEVRLRHGLVLDELLEELQRTEYHLVVAGSSPADDRLRRYIMGNVTREIVNRAELPVLVVRGGTEPDHGLGGLINRLLNRPSESSGAEGSK